MNNNSINNSSGSSGSGNSFCMPKELQWGLIVLAIVLSLVLLTKLFFYYYNNSSSERQRKNGAAGANKLATTASDSDATAAAAAYHRNNKETLSNTVNHIVKEAARWDAMSAQDSNPAYALMHANYALAYANVAHNLMSEDDIFDATNIHIQPFITQLTESQQRCLQNVGSMCPSVLPNNNYAIATGWIG